LTVSGNASAACNTVCPPPPPPRQQTNGIDCWRRIGFFRRRRGERTALAGLLLFFGVPYYYQCSVAQWPLCR